jgi:hypothetical protein
MNVPHWANREKITVGPMDFFFESRTMASSSFQVTSTVQQEEHHPRYSCGLHRKDYQDKLCDGAPVLPGHLGQCGPLPPRGRTFWRPAIWFGA